MRSQVNTMLSTNVQTQIKEVRFVCVRCVQCAFDFATSQMEAIAVRWGLVASKFGRLWTRNPTPTYARAWWGEG
jgi:hypothetical protein